MNSAVRFLSDTPNSNYCQRACAWVRVVFADMSRVWYADTGTAPSR
eukprot:SAG11_NODE_32906_length_280_cov_0.574586_1_plen_45_part_10